MWRVFVDWCEIVQATRKLSLGFAQDLQVCSVVSPTHRRVQVIVQLKYQHLVNLCHLLPKRVIVLLNLPHHYTLENVKGQDKTSALMA